MSGSSPKWSRARGVFVLYGFLDRFDCFRLRFLYGIFVYLFRGEVLRRSTSAIRRYTAVSLAVGRVF